MSSCSLPCWWCQRPEQDGHMGWRWQEDLEDGQGFRLLVGTELCRWAAAAEKHTGCHSCQQDINKQTKAKLPLNWAILGLTSFQRLSYAARQNGQKDLKERLPPLVYFRPKNYFLLSANSQEVSNPQPIIAYQIKRLPSVYIGTSGRTWNCSAWWLDNEWFCTALQAVLAENENTWRAILGEQLNPQNHNWSGPTLLLTPQSCNC